MSALMSRTSRSSSTLRRIMTQTLKAHITNPSTSTARMVPWTSSVRTAGLFANTGPPSQFGYYTVFPVIPDATPENNNFVANICGGHDWPAINSSPAEVYDGAVRMLFEYGATIQEHMQALQTLNPNEISFETVIEPFIREEHDVLYAFHTLWAKMVTDWPTSDELHIDFQRVQELAANEINAKFRNHTFSNAIKVLCENKNLSKWQKRLVDFYYLEMKALAMYENNKKQEQIAGHDSFIEHSVFRYRLNMNDALHKFDLNDKSILLDAPPSILKQLAVDKKDFDKGPWRASLSVHTILPLLLYCSDRAIRTMAWDKWISVASKPVAVRSASNAKTIEIFRRHQVKKATLMGFSTYSEYRLAYKMAESPEIVRKLIKALAKRLRPLFDDRMEAWSTFAAENDKVYTLQSSDLYYYCRKEAENLYEIDPLDMMQHFPFQPTFVKLLDILSYIFNLKFKDVTHTNLERCHPDVTIYSVEDTSNGSQLGHIYVDPYRRENKCCTWDVLLARTTFTDTKSEKIVYLLANIDGNAQSPSLLHYNDLQNLLFNTGRALQMLLSQSPYRDLSIPWSFYQARDADAQDLLPTVVQMFLYKPMLLTALSSPHLQTGAQIAETKSSDIVLGLARASFYGTYRALLWTDFDLTLFDVKDGDRPSWKEVYAEKCKEYFPFKRSPVDVHPCSFAPIFGRSMSMGMYYTRLWSEMLAFDIHDTFDREDDVCNTGERLKRTVLYEGAGEPQRELYRRFQGRDPSPDAMCDFYDPPSHYHLDAAESEAKAAVEATNNKSEPIKEIE